MAEVVEPILDPSVAATGGYAKLKGRVKKALSENLRPDETVRVVIRGAHSQAMIGTDSRVFVCKPGFMAGAAFGAEVTSWGYANLTGVQRHKGLMSGAVVLQGPGQSGKKASYWGNKNDDASKAPNAIPVAGDWKQVDEGVSQLRNLIDAAHAAISAPPTGAAPSMAHELQKLADLRDSGVLTDEEFQAAKARLLSA
jgi:hypothetical protein